MDIEDYLCERLLDVLEEKPLHSIRVTSFVEYADIARSTFYAHFNSIYDVVQRIEDTFLEGFYADDATYEVLVGSNASEAIAQSNFIRKHARAIALLCGPNGDPYFSERLERRIAALCNRVWATSSPRVDQSKRELLSAYIAGGTLAIIKLQARKEVQPGFDERGASASIIAANRILLGLD